VQYFTIGSFTFQHNPSQDEEVLQSQDADMQVLDGTWYKQPSGYERQITLTATIWEPYTRFLTPFSVGNTSWSALTFDTTRNQLWAMTPSLTLLGTTANGTPLSSTSYTGPQSGSLVSLSATPTGTVIVGWSTGLVVEMNPVTGAILASGTAWESLGVAFAGFAGSDSSLFGLSTSGVLYSGTLTGGAVTTLAPPAPHSIADFSNLTLDSAGYLWTTRTQLAQATCLSPWTGRIVASEELRDVGPFTWINSTIAMLYRPTVQLLQAVRINTTDRQIDLLRRTLMSGKVTLTDEIGVSRQVAVTGMQVASHPGYIRGYDVTIQVTETI